MNFMKLSPDQIAAMRVARSFPDELYREVVREIFNMMRDRADISDSVKLSVDIDNENSTLFGVLINKETGKAIEYV